MFSGRSGLRDRPALLTLVSLGPQVYSVVYQGLMRWEAQMRVLEPVLEHNRAVFERLRSKKRRTFLWGLVGMPPLALLVIWLHEYGGYVIATYLAGLGASFLWFEIQMTAVFRRDLRERRDV
jgi:hypothetical protein